MSPADGGMVLEGRKVKRAPSKKTSKKKPKNAPAVLKKWRDQKAQQRQAPARRSKKGSKTVQDDTSLFGHPVILGILFAFGIVCACATFVIAWDTYSNSYPPVSACLRALSLVAAETMFGYGTHILFRMKHVIFGLACCGVVLLCAQQEISVASTQADVTARLKQEAILKEDDAAAPGASALLEVPAIEGGPKKTREVLDAQADARHEAQAREDKRAAERKEKADKRLKLVTSRSEAESWQPAVGALIGALGSAGMLIWLELLIHTMTPARTTKKK